MKASEKAAIRRAVRAAYPGDEVRRAESEALCGHVLAWDAYRRAKCVGGYVPMRREADITPVLEDVLLSGRVLALPRIEAEHGMTLRRVRSLAELVPGPYGLLEPPPDAGMIPAESIELLMVPLEALTREGLRLGKGGGYYDRLLNACAVPTLGAVMSWQWVNALPADPWDKPLASAADAFGIYEWPSANEK